jgi:hypothetical protein
MKRVFETPANGNYFFGYYDKSPFSADNKRLLAMRAAFADRLVKETDILELGFFNWQDSNKFIRFGHTGAWNWQQGCMLQWLGPEYRHEVIYNDRRDNKLITVVLDISTGIERTLPMAYYTISSDGRFALCLDFERHYWFRQGYNYQGVSNPAKADPVDPEDGIWLLDLVSSRLERIISLHSLLEYRPLSSMEEAIHYVDHLMMSPSNRRFLFLHRWRLKDGGVYARLYSANVDGSELYLLNDCGRMSHYCWRSENEIVGWGGLQNPANRIRKNRALVKYIVKPLLPVFHRMLKDGSSAKARLRGDSYILFYDRSEKKERVGVGVLNADGHPSFPGSNRNLMLSDTYPDAAQGYTQELFLYDFDRQEKSLIDRLRHNPSCHNTGYRSDLHPKWSLDGQFICVDTTDKGYRSMFVYG